MKKYDRTVSFRSANSTGEQLVKLKDKADLLKMSDTVYKVDCNNKCKMGEITRSLYV